MDGLVILTKRETWMIKQSLMPRATQSRLYTRCLGQYSIVGGREGPFADRSAGSVRAGRLSVRQGSGVAGPTSPALHVRSSVVALTGVLGRAWV